MTVAGGHPQPLCKLRRDRWLVYRSIGVECSSVIEARWCSPQCVGGFSLAGALLPLR
jgi:hypothetical protein